MLRILDISPLSDTCYVNIFSCSVPCLFKSLIKSLQGKILTFYQIQIIYFFFILLLILYCPMQEIFAYTKVPKTYTYVLSKSLKALALTFRGVIHFE